MSFKKTIAILFPAVFTFGFITRIADEALSHGFTTYAAMLSIGLGCFLLGILFGWLIRNNKVEADQQKAKEEEEEKKEREEWERKKRERTRASW